MKRSTIPSLDDLRAFESVARLGSVRAAADELALTHSAVSRRISKLSREIGIKLVQSDGRGIKITKSGQTIQRLVTNFFIELSQTLNDVKRENSNQDIFISCERSLAMFWLIPNMGKFQESNPEISINLSVGGGGFDFSQERLSLAIRRLDFKIDPTWHVETLFEEEMGVILTKQQELNYLSGNFIALVSKTRPNAWKHWLEKNPNLPAPKDYMYLDHHFLVLEAALSGLGIAICPKVLALNEINRGRILAPNGFIKDGSKYGLIFQNKSFENKETVVVKNWLKSLASNLNV